MHLERFLEKGKDLLPNFGGDEHYADHVLTICQEKLRSFEELNHFVSYFFKEEFEYEERAWSDLKKRDPLLRISELPEVIENMQDFSEQGLEEAVVKLAEEHAVKTGNHIHAVRFALSVRTVGPSFYKMIVVMGRERVSRRLKRALSGK
jgi:glutamyl/glutaminyl-tRNA synthetase